MSANRQTGKPGNAGMYMAQEEYYGQSDIPSTPPSCGRSLARLRIGPP